MPDDPQYDPVWGCGCLIIAGLISLGLFATIIRFGWKLIVWAWT